MAGQNEWLDNVDDDDDSMMFSMLSPYYETRSSTNKLKPTRIHYIT